MGDIAHVAYVASVSNHVASACSNVSSISRHMLHSFLSGCCIYVFRHMLQQYVPNVLAVSILCCSISVFSCYNYFIWMLHIFHTHVASVCPKCFICFKCMLDSSVFCCKCRPPALVSMRTGRAKLRPPTRGGGADHCRRCGEEAHRPRDAIVEEAGGESSGWPGRYGRCSGVEEAGGSSEQHGQRI